MRKKRLASLLAAAALLSSSVPLVAAAQAIAAPVADEASAADAYQRQQPAWHRCSPDQPASYECATIKVPLDYQRPRGKLLDLAISRVRSENPAKRHGIMLLNPGGPGGSGLDLPLYIGESMPKEVREQYDMIGFDPRGVGASTPVTCGLAGPGTQARITRWALDSTANARLWAAAGSLTGVGPVAAVGVRG